MGDVWFSLVAERALERLDADPTMDGLVERLDEALERLSEEPASRWARRRRWQAPPLRVISVRWRDEERVVAWRIIDDQVTVEYIGLDPYR